MSTLLVIGGTGFFGKSILDYFGRGGLAPWGIGKVIVMARNASRLSVETPWLLNKDIELLNADIGTTNWLPTADYIIHAAANTDAKKYLEQAETERVNIQAATYNFCRLAPLYSKDSKIIYTSSGAVYGQQPPDVEFISESAPFLPIEDLVETKRDYAAAKRDAEQAIIELGYKGLNTSIARCFAFVGPYLPRDQHFAIGNFIRDGLAKQTISVKATGKVYRSYMYADDLVRWLMTIADNSSPDCSIYNVGSDQAILMGDLAELVGTLFDVPSDVPVITENTIDRYIPSTELVKKMLKLDIKYDLKRAIQSSVSGRS